MRWLIEHDRRPSPDFVLVASPQSVFVPIGFSSTSMEISVQGINGFNQAVTITVTGLPAGVTTTPSSPFSMGNGISQAIVFNAAAGLQPGLQQVSLQASAGQISHSTSASLSLAKPGYAYIAGTESSNPASYDFAGYAVDANTGALSRLPGSPATLPDAPLAVAATSESGGTFIFVLTGTSTHNNLSGYKAVAESGFLVPVQGITFGGSDGGWIAVHPSGKFLYTRRLDQVNNELCNVAYLIDPTTGSLTESSCSGEPAASFVVPPPGNFAYATSAQDGSVQGYSINQNDGSLTTIQITQAIQNRSVWATDPLGRALYALLAAFPDCNFLETWTIDPNSGSLTLSGVLAPDNSSNYGSLACRSVSIAFAPKDNFAYASSEGYYLHDFSGVFELTVNPATGNLTNANALSPEVLFAQVEPSQGKFMIEGMNYTGLVSVSIDPNTGVLSQPVVTVPLPQPSSTIMIVVAPSK
jgi:6-phosphogluconolactonase (cycloisomerase 2 family)